MIQNYYKDTFIIRTMTTIVSPTKTVKKTSVDSIAYKGALTHLSKSLQFTNDKETVYADNLLYCNSNVEAKVGDYVVSDGISYLIRDVNPGIKSHHKEIACTSQT